VTTPQRVVAYVVRGGELLVFEEEGAPGLQVPAGRSDPGETLEETLRRELREEVGLEARVVRELGSSTRSRADYGVYESHYFHVETDDTRNAWSHVVSGTGEDVGLVFHCRFVPIRDVGLRSDLGEFLHELA
jgi:8-oxo-dGTP pyrophosphatase MutT (NUDIX family)